MSKAVKQQTEPMDETVETRTSQLTSDSKTSSAVIGVFDTHIQAEQVIKCLE
jgi:hypothetical protein